MAAPLPPPVRRLIWTVAIQRFGTGLTLPFTLILLREVRHIPLPTVGLLLAVPGVVGLAAVPVSGAFIDRYGARRVLRGALLLIAASHLALAFAGTVATVLPAVVLLGLGMGPSFPAASALLSGWVEGPEQVQRAFGLHFSAVNAAIGVGSLVGGWVADVHRTGTFQALFLTSAVTAVVQSSLLPRVTVVAPRRHEEADGPSYREALRDPVLRRVCVVSLALAFTGIASLDSGLPAFGRVEGEVSPRVIAWCFVVNTAVIVSTQLLVLRLIRGRRRSLTLAVGAGLWVASWALLGAVPGVDHGTRVALVLFFGGTFGVGETFTAPTLQPMVNAIASDRMRGRYNALSSLGFSIGFVVAPALSGVLIGRGYARAWLALVVASGVLAAVMCARLRGVLTPEQDGLAPSGLDAEREGRLEVVP